MSYVNSKMSLYLQVFVIFFLFNGTNFQSSPWKAMTYELKSVILQFPKHHDAEVIIYKDDVICYNVEWNYHENWTLSVQGNTLNLTILSPVVNDSGIYSHNGFEVELLVRKSPPSELPASIKETDVSTRNTIDFGLEIILIVLLALNIVVLVVLMWKLLPPLIGKCDVPQILSQEMRSSIPNSSGDEMVEMIDARGELVGIDYQSTQQRITNIEDKLDKLITCFNNFNKNLRINNSSDEQFHATYQVEDVDVEH